MEHWSLGQLGPWEPATAWLIGAGLVLLAVVAIGHFIRRKRQRKSDLSKRDPFRIVAYYRSSHPSFCRILTAFLERNDGGRFIAEKEEVRRSFATLAPADDRVGRARKWGRNQATVLQLSGGGTGNSGKVEAAMLTILRVIYMHPEYRSSLGAQDILALDRLLDKVTAERQGR